MILISVMPLFFNSTTSLCIHRQRVTAQNIRNYKSDGVY